MGRFEKIRILNSLLLEEMPEYRQQAEQFAEDLESQRRLLRSLMNVRYPGNHLNPEFLRLQEDEKKLESCYRSCMELAKANGIRSIAFCCISTGVFCFPNGRAAEIAIQTVREYLKGSHIQRVVFNVFQDHDKSIYEHLLKCKA